MKKNFIFLLISILMFYQFSSSASPQFVMINGCVNKKTQVLRVVDKCNSTEVKIQWGQQGISGNDGKDGINGKDGLNGTDGNDGADGKDGVNGKDGINGKDGVPGIAGPRGADGVSNSVLQYKLLDQKDIVVDGSISELNKGKKVILGSFSAKDFGLGAFQLEAYLEGNWSDSALNRQSIIKCYFQRKKDYDSAGTTSLGGYSYGAAETQYNSWNTVTLTVNGDDWWLSQTDDPTYLVCVATGSIKGLDGLVKAFPYSKIKSSGQ